MRGPSGPSGASKSPRRPLASTVVGLVLALGGSILVGRALVNDWAQVSPVVSGAKFGWLSAAFGLALAGMLGIANAWRETLASLEVPVTRRDALSWYFTGELAKYLPGLPWAVVGRAEMAASGGVERPTAYASVFLSLLATYISAVLVAASVRLSLGASEVRSIEMVALVLALVTGAFALHPRVLSPVLRVTRRLSSRIGDLRIPQWRACLGLVAFNLPAWLAIGVATWCVTQALGADASVAEIVSASVFSWVVGFVAVPAPSGLGVREAAFIIAAASMPEGLAAATAVVARVLFMLADAIGAGAFGLVGWAASSSTERRGSQYER